MSRFAIRFTTGLLIIFLLFWKSTQVIAQTAEWPMPGQNPERTSWSTEQVNGKLVPDWYKIFKGAYIATRTQLVAANNTIFVATSRGLYAIDSANGSQKWVFQTEMPVGDPTYVNGVIYFGGFDRKMYALDAATGAKKWHFVAEGGFQVSPVVVNNVVYAGNRDGYFYALDAGNGSLKWKFKAGGPITFAPAYKDNTLYFAANDNHAYAVNTGGSQVWKSVKLTGAGFHSWWPVVVGNLVIFGGSENYRDTGPGAFGSLSNNLDMELYKKTTSDLIGPLGPSQTWAGGAKIVDLSKVGPGAVDSVANYYENKPWRRTFHVLDRTTGAEKRYDIDGDGKQEYAPILWLGAHSGTRYPPIVNPSGVIFTSTSLWDNGSIPRGQIVGWNPATPQYVSLPYEGKNATDEPQGYAGGGNIIYWARCCDRVGASFTITSPFSNTSYFGYNLYTSILPGYRVEYYNPDTDQTSPNSSYGASVNDVPGKNGVYGDHGDTHGPIPYKGRVYLHKSNSLIAWGTSGAKTRVADATVGTRQVADVVPSKETIRTKLMDEIKKIVNAGRLRPGFHGVSILDLNWAESRCGDSFLLDYWARPGETLYSLAIAMPHITDSTLKASLKSYLDAEYAARSPVNVKHIGWKDAKRESFITPDDVQSALSGSGPASQGTTMYSFEFYGLWKYAKETGMSQSQAQTLFNAAKGKFPSAPSDSLIKEFPWHGNAYIAGLIGYNELEKMAGGSGSKTTEINNMMSKVASLMAKDSPWQEATFVTNRLKGYCHNLNTMRNFLYMTPEFGNYLNTNTKTKIQEIYDHYNLLTPYWFVGQLEITYGEGVMHHMYDMPAMFQAKALALKEPYSEVAKYIDYPGFERGDLFYIQNLVYALEASGTGPTPPPSSSLQPSASPFAKADVNHDGSVNYLDMRMILNNFSSLASSVPNYFDPVGDAKINTLDAGYVVKGY